MDLHDEYRKYFCQDQSESPKEEPTDETDDVDAEEEDTDDEDEVSESDEEE
jgi:hypothetical protein